MGFVKSLAISIIRPIYRALFERPLWWFLSKVKDYFFAETNLQLESIERRLAQLEGRPTAGKDEEQWSSLHSRLRSLEASGVAQQGSNAAQWDAIEQLLLAMFRQPEVVRVETAVSSGISDGSQPVAEAERAHAAGHIH